MCDIVSRFDFFAYFKWREDKKRLRAVHAMVASPRLYRFIIGHGHTLTHFFASFFFFRFEEFIDKATVNEVWH